MLNLKWWFIFCASMAALVTTGMMGLLDALWFADVSKLSFAILGLYFTYSAYLGYLTSQTNHRCKVTHIKKNVKTGWFMSELMLGLGMIGTLVGFLILLNVSFASVDVSNTAAIKKLIADMSLGFSTSSLTTLVGLIASFLLKLQLVNIEYELKHE
jgi:hypothetical protein